MKMKTTEVREELARLRLPEKTLADPHHSTVFFNERMEFNRSISVLALKASKELFDTSIVCDGLCASGARGIRYALEGGARKIFFVDANPDAIAFVKKNVALNGLKKKSVVACQGLNEFFLEHQREFDFVEVDPFGSPAPFIENAFRALKKKGILSITATDFASTGGTHPRPCVRRYDARPLKTEYAHENALRIIVGRIARTGAALDFAVKPLASFCFEHAAKTFVLCEESAAGADAALKEIGFVNHCFKCLNRVVSRKPVEKCGECGARFDYAGPLWVGSLGDEAFLKKMLTLAENEREKKFVELLLEENGLPPGFFDLHKMAGKFGGSVRKTGDVVAALKKKGFRASRTHFTGIGVKTNAGVKELRAAVARA